MATTTRKRGDGSGAGAGMLGSLAHTPLAEVFRRIVREELSGDLQVTVPNAIKTVYFDRGFVVFASSNLKSDRLGESMIEAGRLSRQEFALASMLVKNTKRKFGQVLVDAGIIGDEELGRHVAAQVNRIVLSLFSATKGVYSFDERPSEIPVELMVSLSSYRILIDGVRRMSKKSLVLAGLPSLDTKVEITDQPPFSLDVEKLRDVEKRALQAVAEGATIRQVVEKVDGNEGVTLRACYGLLCGGVLRAEIPDARASLLRVQEETGTFVLSEIRQKVSRKKEEVVRARDEPSAPEPAATTAEPTARPVTPPTIAVPSAPRPIASSEPAPSAEPAEGSGGFLAWLTKGLEAFLRFCGRLFGAVEPSSDPTSVTREPSSPPLRREVTAAPPVAEMPPPAVTTTPSPEPPEGERVGIPSWSMKDSPAEEAPVEPSIGAPAWSMKDDPSRDDTEAPIETLGTPWWSMKDDPSDSRPKRRAKPVQPRPEPRVDPPVIEAPPVETSTDPGPVAFESPPESVRQPEPGLSSRVTDETLDELDSELFIDDESDSDAPSMLSQIPVESVAVDESAVEIEVEVEIDEEALVELAESEPADAGSTVMEAEASHEVSEEVAEPASAAPGPGEEVSPATSLPPPQETEGVEPTETTARAREMNRIKQSGGEARLLRDVKLHFRMRDWEGVVPLLQQLVEISPGKALYRGMLARAMSRHPVMRKEAEEHFVEALRLSPQDPELHYWLGIYYQSFGLKARAVTEFRTTLRINPKHEGARKQLFGDGKKDDALGAVMKKLFG